MTDKEKIIAEIERLKAEAFNNIKNRSLVTDVANSQRIAICKQLLDFINSLPAEQPSEDLEKEVDKQWNEEYRPYDSGYRIAELSLSDYKETARHFAQWQKEQMMKSAVSIGYLQDWYQNSIDEEVPPIWTDEHLNELTKDFYLIPKQNEDEQCSTE